MDAEKIKQIRKDHKLSTAELGKIAGVSRRTVEGWEQGRPVQKPCLMLIEKFIFDSLKKEAEKSEPITGWDHQGEEGFLYAKYEEELGNIIGIDIKSLKIIYA